MIEGSVDREEILEGIRYIEQRDLHAGGVGKYMVKIDQFAFKMVFEERRFNKLELQGI